MRSVGTVVLISVVVSLAAAQQKNKSTITGEVIGLRCYLAKGEAGRGEAHRKCAIACAKKGVPLAILQEKTESIYLAAKARGMSGANEMLMPFVGDRVSARGTVEERGGVKMLFIDSIEKSP